MSEQPSVDTIVEITNDDRFKQRLAEFNKRKSEAEAAEARASQAKADAQQFIEQAEQVKQQHTAEIVAAQRKHDDAADEAARRIRLGNAQADELARLKAKHDERDKELLAQANGLAAREEKHKRDAQLLAETAAQLQIAKEVFEQKVARMRAALQEHDAAA